MYVCKYIDLYVMYCMFIDTHSYTRPTLQSRSNPAAQTQKLRSVLPISSVVSPTGSGHAWHSARSRCAAVCVYVCDREQETEKDRGTG